MPRRCSLPSSSECPPCTGGSSVTLSEGNSAFPQALRETPSLFATRLGSRGWMLGEGRRAERKCLVRWEKGQGWKGSS